MLLFLQFLKNLWNEIWGKENLPQDKGIGVTRCARCYRKLIPSTTFRIESLGNVCQECSDEIGTISFSQY